MLKEFGFTAWNDITNLLTAQSGKEVVSKTHRLIKDRGFLILSELGKDITKNTLLIDETIQEITNPIHLKVATISKIEKENKTTIYVDKNNLSFPLTLRKWQNGDFFYPKGMQGKKKVSKYFKDEKFSTIDKENTWLLCTSTNKIIWIVGHRQDHRFLTTENASSILKIEIL